MAGNAGEIVGQRADEASLPPVVSAAVFADPAQSLGYLLRIAFRAFSRSLETRTAPHGVTSGQWRFLRQLWVEDGLTQRELSRRVGMREPTTVVAVNSLVKAGLATRVPSDRDRRKVHIHLTPRAVRLQATLLPLVAEINARATVGLSAAEVEALRHALHLLSDNLAAHDEPVPAADDATP